jgi:hypothetical protein
MVMATDYQFEAPPFHMRGKPVPGVTNKKDAIWELTKARRWIFEGGDRNDPAYIRHINMWLDFMLKLRAVETQNYGA